MQRKYEVMYILRPDIAEEDVEKLTTSLESAMTKGGSQSVTTEKMGMRKLAYTVRKFKEGLYMLMTLEASGEQIAELERRLRVTEQVIKFLTVRMDEEEKRLAKVRKQRSMHVKQSAQRASAPEATSAEGAAVPAVTAAVDASPSESAAATV